MNQSAILGLCCAVVCFAVCLPLYKKYKPTQLSLSVCFKSLGTLCAFVPALIAAVRLDSVYWLVAAALFLHAVADSLLEYNFIAGMGVFILGHIPSIAFLLKQYPFSAAHVICMILIMVGFAFLLWKFRKPIGKGIPAFAVYGAVLSAMGAFAIAGGAASATIPGLMRALAGALFLFSDGLVFLDQMYPERSEPIIPIMVTYYAAQLLFGIACLF